MLTNLEAGDVLFVDEIHRLSPRLKRCFIRYGRLSDIMIVRPVEKHKLELSPFTLVGATTRAGLLTSPLRDRFGIVQRLEFYSIEELTKL